MMMVWRQLTKKIWWSVICLCQFGQAIPVIETLIQMFLSKFFVDVIKVYNQFGLIKGVYFL